MQYWVEELLPGCCSSGSAAFVASSVQISATSSASALQNLPLFQPHRFLHPQNPRCLRLHCCQPCTTPRPIPRANHGYSYPSTVVAWWHSAKYGLAPSLSVEKMALAICPPCMALFDDAALEIWVDRGIVGDWYHLNILVNKRAFDSNMQVLHGLNQRNKG